jgi:lipopolysaccharide/colanic/teichoic acid biosynthesis glycosyltransferase
VIKRLFDIVCTAAGLLVLMPMFALVALIVRLCDGSPVFFSQTRIGRNGEPFRIWKFRTMRICGHGSAVTAAGDSRVTRTGAVLRKYKIDELPQLFNVLKGDMSLVGPRPEVPEYVRREALIWQLVLQVRPGITDLASLTYRNEEEMLGRSADADALYREQVLPAKLRLNLEYLHTRSLRQDLALIWLTIRYSLRPQEFDPHRIHKTFGTGVGHDGYLHSVSSPVDR